MEEPIREASQQVSEEFKTLVDAQDLNSLRHLQHLMYVIIVFFFFWEMIWLYDFSLVAWGRLGRLQDSNAVLSHYNDFAESCFADVSLEFSRNTRLLKSMKADLDYIFLKLRLWLLQGLFFLISYKGSLSLTSSALPHWCFRSIKSKIMATYPDAFPDESTSDAFDRRPDLELPQ